MSWTGIPLMSFQRLLWLMLLVGVSLSIPSWLTGKNTLAALADISPMYLIALVICMALGWLLHIARYVVLLMPYADRKIPVHLLLCYYLAIQFASRTTPLGAGAPTLEYMIIRKYGIRLNRMGAAWMTTTTLDACSVLLWCTLIMVVSQILPTESSPFGLELVVIAAGIIPLGAFFLLSQRRALIAGTLRLLQLTGTGVARRHRIARFLLQFSRNLYDFLHEPLKKQITLIALSLLYWGSLLSLLWLSILSTGAHSGWLDAMAIQAIASTLGHLSLLPGGAIGSEATAAWLLTTRFPDHIAGIAIFLWRGVVFYIPTFAGLLCFLYIQRHLATQKEEQK